MNRRLPATKATQRLENQRAEEPTPACVGNSTPYDVLHDYVSGPEYRAARREALAICDECPIKARCWIDNADTPWVKALRRPARPDPNGDCGTHAGVNRHRRRKEPLCESCVTVETERRARSIGGVPRSTIAQQRVEERTEELHAMCEQGLTLTDACAALNVSRGGLQKWCSRHAMSDVYRQLGLREATTVNGSTRAEYVAIYGEPPVRRARRKKVAA